MESVKKNADAFFSAQKYSEAKELYSQLVSLFPKDPNYNYRFGACLLFVDSDKAYPLKFLEYAVSQPNVDVEAFYFLGKGYHYNYRFTDALIYLRKYQVNQSKKSKVTYPVEADIRYCENGLNLLKKISKPVVYSKKKVLKQSLIASYNLQDQNAKLLKAPGDLKSSVDKKMMYDPMMFKNKNFIFYSSYGDNTKSGTDIFMIAIDRFGNLVGDPIRLPSTINTPYDEGFAFLSDNGEDFYFASKGHNSMGGFDIFSAKFDPYTNSFYGVKNLDYSINTPDNDFLYVEQRDSGKAFFSTDRNCEEGKAYVYTIEKERIPFSFVVLAGTFKNGESQSCKITVEDLKAHVVVGSFGTNAKDGTYLMQLESGGKYNFLVEPVGENVAYQGQVNLPKQNDLSVLRQTIEVVQDGEEKKLIIRNLFESSPQEGDADLIATVLMQSADMEVSTPVEVTISNEQIIEEIRKDKVLISEQISTYEKDVRLSFELAVKLREMAQKDLELAEKLENEVSINDTTTFGNEKRKELADLLNRAKMNSMGSEMAFKLAQDMEAQIEEEKGKRNDLEGYLVRIENASSTQDSPQVKTYYKEYTAKKERYTPLKMEDFLEEKLKNTQKSYQGALKKASRTHEEISEVEAEIERSKAQLFATKKEKDKQPIAQMIEELESEKVLLQQKEQDYLAQANSVLDEVNQIKSEMVAMNEVQGMALNGDASEFTAAEKSALIVSIMATTDEIVAMEELRTNQVKNMDSEEDVAHQLKAENTEEEPNNTTQTNAFEDWTSSEDTANLASNEELNTEQPNNAVAENQSESITNDSTKSVNQQKDLGESVRYETPVEQMIIVEGLEVPLEINALTGKRPYSKADLADLPVVLGDSEYQSTYLDNLNELSSETSTLKKAKQTQLINYNWLVDTEKEIALLTFEKEQTSNQKYINQLDNKIDELNQQAEQKRNFLKLNSAIILQLEEQLAEANQMVTEEDSTINILEIENQTVTNSEVESELETISDTKDVIAENPDKIDPETKNNPDIEIPKIEENVNGENIAPIAKESDSTPTPSVDISLNLSTQLVKESQEEIESISDIAESLSSELEALNTQLQATRKKKEKVQIASQMERKDLEIARANEQISQLKRRQEQILAMENALIADPLDERPSEDLMLEAQQKMMTFKNSEQELNELQLQLQSTRKKRKKREIQAQINALQNQMVIEEVQANEARVTAIEIQRLEEHTLKTMTPYGTSVMVKLPNVDADTSFSKEMYSAISEEETYLKYKEQKNNFNSKLDEARILAKSADARKLEANKLQEQITELAQFSTIITGPEKDSLNAQILDLQVKQKRLLKQAEVLYNESKILSNQAYFDLNEANKALLTLPNPKVRTHILQALSIEENAPPAHWEQASIAESTPIDLNEENIDKIPQTLVSDIFVTNNNAFYSSEKKIPVDVELPKGVIYKVQIGAFRNAIPPETFKGFAPIVGERTASGLTRYTAGLFVDFETADQAKSAIRNKGYTDAFVVAYLNGERISIARAKSFQTGAGVAQQNQGASSDQEVGNESEIIVNNKTTGVQTSAVSEIQEGETLTVSAVSQIKNLYFTVQVGVYKNDINPTTVFKISPLNKDELDNGLVRYSAGIYNTLQGAINAKSGIITQSGIQDAFVTAYYNGQRIAISEAKELLNQIQPSSTNTPQSEELPNASTESAPKTSGTYTVVVGPYASDIPIESARVLLQLSSLGINVIKSDAGTLYKIGNFTDVKEAEALVFDLISKGLVDPKLEESESF